MSKKQMKWEEQRMSNQPEQRARKKGKQNWNERKNKGGFNRGKNAKQGQVEKRKRNFNKGKTKAMKR